MTRTAAMMLARTALILIMTPALGHPDPAPANQPWSARSALYETPPPPEGRQFDFLIGSWDVIARRFDPRTGTLLAEVNVVQDAEYRNQGRMVVEEWTARSPATGQRESHGVTLRTWSPVTGHWQVAYLESHQPTPASTYVMQAQGQQMVGHGTFEHPSAGTVRYRLRFFDISADAYQWVQEYSIDGGTWFLERTQTATRRTGSDALSHTNHQEGKRK